jgi:hypothetical protein
MKKLMYCLNVITLLIVSMFFAPANALDRPAGPVAYPDSLTHQSGSSLLLLWPEFGKKTHFWVVNFGTARTLPPGKIGFAAGLGGQVVFLGDPKKTSAFFTIPHAGFRLGLTNRLDMGLRLAPIPLPFSTVGPGFGVNFDAKYRLTKPESNVDLALILGLGGAHVLIEDRSRYAYSPNIALLNSYHLGETTSLTMMGRYVHLGIPTAPQGAKANFVNISGLSLGLKKDIKPNIALLPEVGAYWYEGRITGIAKSGLGFQYGLMLATSF